MIKPSVNRAVLFYPPDAEHNMARTPGMGLAAIIVRVWSDTCVNLVVFDANGNTHGRTSVLLVQPGAAKPAGGYYCEWPEHVRQGPVNATPAHAAFAPSNDPGPAPVPFNPADAFAQPWPLPQPLTGLSANPIPGQANCAAQGAAVPASVSHADGAACSTSTTD